MKSILKKLLPFCTLIFVSVPAFAGMHLEPYVGYGLMGATGTQAQISAKTNNNYTTLAGGARLLLDLGNVLFLGPDATYHQGMSATSLLGAVSNGGAMQVGVVAGLNLLFLRVWAGYNFLDQNTSTVNTTVPLLGQVDVKNAYSGTSMKVGAGIKLLPMLRLNAEYLVQTYNSQTATVLGQATTTSLTGSNVVDGKLLLVSASLSL